VLLPKPFLSAPIDDKHYYSYSRVWHYGKAEAMQFIRGALDKAIPVYALFVSSEHLDQDLNRLPEIQGYTWERSKRSDRRTVIMVLTRKAGTNSLPPVPAQQG
jgi:hypothetical protein